MFSKQSLYCGACVWYQIISRCSDADLCLFLPFHNRGLCSWIPRVVSEVHDGFFWLLKQYFTLVYECLGLFLLFGFGLRFMCSDWFPWSLIQFLRDFPVKSGGLKDGFCPRNVLDRNWVVLKFCKDDPEISVTDETEEKMEGKSDVLSTHSDKEFDVETEDVSVLRNLVKTERRRVSAAAAELEQERAASASAAAEAMAMILRLQNEKSSVELELNQYRRLASEKQIHDQIVIQSLRDLVWGHESERRVLEHQLRSRRQESSDVFSGVDERFEGIEDVLENVLYSSRCLDFN